jgi:hypothetical protein
VGIIPLLTVAIAFVLNIQMMFYKQKTKVIEKPFLSLGVSYNKFSNRLITYLHLWTAVYCVFLSYFIYQFYVNTAYQISPKNVMRSYYDAIDFKEFEKAYSFINPESKLSVSQFMLQTSVADGI